MPDVSVLIPCYNRADAIGQTLSPLAGQTVHRERFEVIVVDDGSTDGSVRAARALHVPYSLKMFSQGNSGAGAARNLAAQQASAPFLVFLDADMIAAPDLVEQYLAARAVHSHALIIGRQSPWPDAYQSSFDRLTRFEWFRDLGPNPLTPAFFHVLSSNMAISREDFTKLGGFDPQVGIGARPATDDTDLGYRAQKLGLELVYWPAALAYHNHPRTFAQRCEQQYVVGLWTARMFERYPEMADLIPAFRDVQPIRWQANGPVLLARKAKRQLAALKPCLLLMEYMTGVLERHFPSSGLLRSVYWAILGAYRFNGFRAGLQRR